MPITLDAVWPAVLLVLRLGVALVLYAFLFASFRVLRAELRTPVADPVEADGWPEARTRSAPEVWEDDFEAPVLPRVPRGRPAPVPASTVAGPATGAGAGWVRDRVRAKVAIPIVAALLVVTLGSVALFSMERPDAGEAPAAASGEAFGPPAVEPRAGRVTVGLAAVDDSHVRVTVDGVVEFDGMLAAGRRQAWEGGQRIQVWTDSGRTLQLAVNGEVLGAYSPAMGHPDWNRIDFGFWPGWGQ